MTNTVTDDKRSDSLLGQQLDEYRLDALLGSGGMARVYRGFDVGLERPVAIKVIDPPHRRKPDYVRRFEREARAIAQLKHPHIVGVYRYGQARGVLYMAMEYIDGVDLRAGLISYRAKSELMPPKKAGQIISQIGQALDYAHNKGVIHRDIKPSNIMLDQQGNAYLTDFGLVMLQDQKTAGQAFGTPHYMAPEQVILSAKAIPQSDLYAMGVILYEMFTGHLPFDAPHPHDIALMHLTESPPPPQGANSALSPALEAVILKAMAKEAADRYQTGAALADALTEALRERPKIGSNQEESMPEKDHLRRLIAIYQRRLQKLEERKAYKGIDADPGISMEIEDLQRDLQELRAELEFDLTGQSIGKYPLHTLIDEGGMAKVYRGWHPGLLRNVAIKVMDDRLFKEEAGEEFIDRFQSEAITLANLQHPHIIRVYDFARENHKCYMVMDLIEGPTLEAKLKGNRRTGAVFPVAQAVQIISALADALDYIHTRGIIHHDLKPANVMFISDDPEAEVILTDFGIARLIGAGGMTQVILGTPTYMAPEQFMQEREDKRSDIYALGLILYEMVAGQPPFTADSPFAYMMQHATAPVPPPSKFNPALPPAVEQVILKALSKNPQVRYRTAGEMAQALESAIEKELEQDDRRKLKQDMERQLEGETNSVSRVERLRPGKTEQQLIYPEDSPSDAPAEFHVDVFIAYNLADRTWVVSELLPRLEGAGLQVMIEERDFVPGMPRRRNIRQAVKNSRHTLAVLTPAFVKDDWDGLAALMAGDSDPMALELKLLPLLLKECNLPEIITDLSLYTLDFTQERNRESNFERLIRAIKAPR